MITADDDIAKGRDPIPSIESMLREMGSPFPEPGWLEMGYSLLSQITHNTPLGQLHTIRYQGGTWHGHELSPEMLGLALDVAWVAPRSSACRRASSLTAPMTQCDTTTNFYADQPQYTPPHVSYTAWIEAVPWSSFARSSSRPTPRWREVLLYWWETMTGIHWPYCASRP